MDPSISPHSHGMRRSALLPTAVFLAAALALSAGLWAAPPQISVQAVQQMQALRSVKTTKSPMQNKIDSRLFLGLLHQRNDARLAPLTSFRFVQPGADGKVPVDVVATTSGGVKAIASKLESLGADIKSMSYHFHRVSARMRLADLETLAAMPQVRKVRQHMPFLTSAINVSEGDKTHGADEARSFFGVIGTNVKVCAISDGVDSLAALQASGDLPPNVDVIPGAAGAGDEGSAMLEIIHDLAPGAALGFAEAGPDEAGFAQHILDLAAAGCNIIVDDIIYLDESPFEDGPVAQSVNTVTAAGVLYFSSAGNEGNKDDLTSGTWEGDFLASGAADPAPLAGANLHNFGDGGNSILVEFGGGNPPLLIWAEHFDLATGTASTDFDIYDMDGGLTTIFDASTDVQDGVGGDDFPIEFIGNGTFGGERLLIDKFAAGTTSSVPMFNLIVFRGELDDALATRGATRGHSAAAAAFSVAATPAAASFDGITPDGPFPGLFTAANETESFSSDGPRRIILDPTGAELTPGNRTSTGGVVRQKPDITAADGVSTAAPGFNPFYGTSAAAPHAAAIAALIKSGAPGITPAQVRTALVSTAIDIEARPTDAVDPDTGAGIVMAHAAMVAGGVTPQALLSAGAAVPTQLIGDGDAFVEPNETWTLTIPLTNIGAANATAINAVLTSSTPGVVIAPPASAYPDLAPGASANNTTLYGFTVTQAFPCGGVIQFTLTVTYTGGVSSPQTFNFSITTGSPGAPVTVSYTNPPVAIPDGADLSGTAPGAPVSATLNVATIPGNVLDVDLRIDGTACSATAGSTTVGLDHTFVNDLEITLIAPNGSQVKVIDNTDGSGNNFCQTLLNDDGGDPPIQGVATAAAPFTGSFTPASALSALDGTAANGNWQLQAQDFFSQDTGNIRAWSLIITPAICDAPAQTANVTATKTASGNFVPGGAITYTVTLTNSGTGAQPDDPASNEFTDTLPAGLTLTGASAVGNPGPNGITTAVPPTVTWNGTIPAGGTVTITINATVNQGTAGQTISNQGTVNFDSDGDGTNNASGVTDDPSTGTAGDPTSRIVGNAGFDPAIPTLSEWGLAVLCLALAGAALVFLRRRRSA
jgi:fimbrial isopeptide formation D2 family protein